MICVAAAIANAVPTPSECAWIISPRLQSSYLKRLRRWSELVATVDRASAQLVGLATRELELCRVQGDETVLIYSDPDSRPELVGAVFAAANNLSDLAMEVVRPLIGTRASVSRRASLPGPLRKLAESVDMLIDVSSRGMLHGGDIQNLLAAGTRILRVREPAPVLARLFPDEKVAQRIAASGRLLERARSCTSTPAPAPTSSWTAATARCCASTATAQRQVNGTTGEPRWPPSPLRRTPPTAGWCLGPGTCSS